MADSCCKPPGMWRPVLWIALAINAGMFLTEVVAGLMAGSVSLQADALDFLGDTLNYGISLTVVGMALSWRARAALFKGATMGAFGLWVLGITAWQSLYGSVPHAGVMGIVGILALLANGGVALMLYRFRTGDSNMRSVWVCSRNDAIGNVAVLLAALGVFGTGTMWPDVIVGSVMAALALQGSRTIIRHAASDLNEVGASAQTRLRAD
jgi:Co/Zn/Cd efflux system component